MTKPTIDDIAEAQLTIMQKYGIDNWCEYKPALNSWARRHWKYPETDQEIVAALSQWGLDDWEFYEKLDIFFYWEKYLDDDRENYLSYYEYYIKFNSLENIRLEINKKITEVLNN